MKKILFLLYVFIGITFWSCKDNTQTNDLNVLPNDNATTKPSIPTGLMIGNPTSSSLGIVWDAVLGASSYQVFYDLSANGLFITQSHSTLTTFATHTGLSSSTTYYYKVRATNSIGSSELSSAVSGTTNISTPTPQPTSKPSIPTGLATSGATASSIVLSWTAVSGASSYQAYLSTNMLLSSPVQIYNNTGNSFTATGLSGGTTYYFGVIATNSSGSSVISIPVSGTTLPATPTGVTVGSATSTSLKISWNNVVGSSYQINRSQSSSFTYPSSFEVFASPYTDTGLLGQRKYYYRVRAVNSSGGVSAWSGTYSGTTL